MKIDETLEVLRNMEDEISRRKRIGFTNLLIAIDSKKLPDELLNLIEEKLEGFRKQPQSAHSINKQMKDFRYFLTKDLKMKPKNYYSSLGTGLGLALGTSLGISIGAAFGLPLGPIFGLTIGSGFGLIAGIFAGKKYDQQAEKDKLVLEHL